MPYYKYKCTKCNNMTEVNHSMKTTPTIICEKCQGECEKFISGKIATKFVGSGFHTNEYIRHMKPKDYKR